MIITQTPFRISFAGGGSDLPSFYEKNGGCVISTTINKYMFISMHPSFNQNETAVKYTRTEIVNDVSKIEHRYFNRILSDYDVSGVEITSTADVPSGTGLGSSSSFTVGLLNAIYNYKHQHVTRQTLAKEACDMEIVRLQQNIGKQDQYAATFGGLNYIKFNMNGSVSVEPVVMKSEDRSNLENSLVMYYIGGTHSADEILKNQSKNMKKIDKEENQKQMCELAEKLRIHLTHGETDRMGPILDENWELKKSLSTGISNGRIDEIYRKGIECGATGGKLLGAGGGGFMLFHVPLENRPKFDDNIGMKKMDFKFESAGSIVIYSGE